MGAAVPVGSAGVPALEAGARGAGSIHTPKLVVSLHGEVCNQDVDHKVQDHLNTGRRWPRRQGQVTLLPHLHASIRLSAFHQASRCALEGKH